MTDIDLRRMTRRQSAGWLARCMVAAALPAATVGCAAKRQDAAGRDRPMRDETFPSGGRDASLVAPDRIGPA